MADSNRSNQNSTQIMDAEGIASSIRGKLVQYRPPPISQCSIFKVPNMLRRDNEKAFTPEVVSIGPFHRNNTQLQEMENNKLWYLKCFLNRTRITELNGLVEAIESIEQDCRKCYSDQVGDLRRDKFIEMMVIDGCFILEFLCRYMDNLSLIQAEDDPVFKTSGMPRKIIADLLLLENQLPWCVLDCLFNLMPNLKTPHQRCSRLDELVSCFFMSEYTLSPYLVCDRESVHLLDWLRNCLVQSCTTKVQPRGIYSPPRGIYSPSLHILSVTELSEVGVRCRIAHRDTAILNMKFENGTIRIPSIDFNQNTSSI